MKELALSAVTTNPGTFTLSPGDPMYYTEHLSYNVHKILYNLGVQGFRFLQQEETDYNALEEALDTYADQIDVWMGNAVAASSEGLPVPTAPSIPDIITGVIAILTGNPLLALLVKIGVHLAVKWLEKKLNPDTTAQEIAQKLQQIHDLLERVLEDTDGYGTVAEAMSEFIGVFDDAFYYWETINGEEKKSILYKALLDLNAEGKEFSLLWALARQAIHILLTSEGYVDDVEVQDYPDSP